MGSSSYKIYSGKLIIPILVMIVLSFNIVSGDQYSTGTMTANGGSTYELLLDMNNATWVIGDTISIIESIKPLSFGSDIRDLHDIKLSILLSDGADFSHTDISYGLGIADTIGETYDVMWLITVDNSFPASFSIYFESEFREDKSGTFDPRTEDGWNWVVDISVIEGIDTPEVNNPIEQNLAPTIDPAYDVVYEINSTRNILRWVPHDDEPSTYEISRDGVFIETGNWSDGVAIELNVDNLTMGDYIYVLEVSDGWGLSSSSSAIVSVTDGSISSVTTESEDQDSTFNGLFSLIDAIFTTIEIITTILIVIAIIITVVIIYFVRKGSIKITLF